MDAVQLTELFLTYNKTAKALEEIREKIAAEVLLLKDSRKIAGVRATYYKPGKPVVNWEAVGQKAPPEVVKACTTSTPSTDWDEVATHSPAEIIEKYTKLEPVTDWEKVIAEASTELIAKYTTYADFVDWEAVAKEAGLEPAPEHQEQKPARVIVKLEDE